MSAPRLDIDKTRDRLLSLGCTYAAEGLGRVLADACRETSPPMPSSTSCLTARSMAGRPAVERSR